MASTRKPGVAKSEKPGPKTAARAGPEPRQTETKRAGRKRPHRRIPEPTKPSPRRPILPGPWPANALAFLLLIAATLGLYAGDLRLGFFNVDDPTYVVNNPWIRSVTPENLGHILGAPYY